MKDMWTNIIRLINKKLDRITSIPAALSTLAGYVQPLLIVFVITISSFLLVDIFYNVVSLRVANRPAVGKSHSSTVASLSDQAQPVERYNVIPERNLFLTTLKAIVDKSAILPSEEYTAYDLKGTIAVDQSIGYAIVEEKGKSKQKLYRIGEMIGSAKLVRITRNTAILASGGREFIMKIKDVAEGALAGRSSRPGEGIAISKQEVTQSLGDLKSIMSQAVLRPFLRDGMQQGFIVSNIVPNSIYQKLGLQNGDIIMDVNNNRLESADDLLQLVGVIQGGGSVSVDLIRNGRNETINYTFH